MSKALIQAVLDGLPQEFDMEEFLERVALLEKIKHSRAQVDRAETITFYEMRRLAQSWKK